MNRWQREELGMQSGCVTEAKGDLAVAALTRGRNVPSTRFRWQQYKKSVLKQNDIAATGIERFVNAYPSMRGLGRLDERMPTSLRLEERLILFDLQSYLPDDSLVKFDCAAMATALDTRMPLLDHRAVEFALHLPLHQRRRGGEDNWLIRRLLDRQVPCALVERPKMGFGTSLHSWLRGPLRAGGLLNPAVVLKAWVQHLQGEHDWGHQLCPVLMLEARRDHVAGLARTPRSAA